MKRAAFLSQFATVIIATLNAVSDGMNYGWSSPMLPRLRKENSPIKITENDEPWLESILLFAGIVGLPLTTYLVDRIGRKQSTLTAACSCVVGWTIIAFANDVIYLYIARFIMGIAADIAFISSPMYIAEISHKSIRGYLSAIIYVMSYMGTVLIYIIGPYVDFYVPSVVAGVFLVSQIILLPFMPDSPYFLIKQGKTEMARQSLKRLRATDDVNQELTEILNFIEQENQQEKGKVTDLFTVPSIRRAVIIMTVLNGGQHFAGYTAISMNVHSILESANSTYFDKETATIMYGCLMLFGSIVATLLVDKFGRKTLLMVSAVTTGISLGTIGVYFYLQVDNDLSAESWLPVAALMTFAVTFKIGLGTVPIVLTAELFPVKVKAYGMASADGIYVIFGSLSVWIYDILRKDAGGMYMPFYFFAGCSFITCIFACLFVPETKGVSLEEVQIILKGK
ncbi:facilitated trehalose transporter Tret1-like [Harmonia axyridis]|uniref:facilitated trehalose transporter Tret1-like n=1 Tax=Harmonia axyridis TaxID=115357 RepID=UPI001E275A0F|nr:facilitated trehalose transporter Tret1-like [Harmonia axyridis]